MTKKTLKAIKKSKKTLRKIKHKKGKKGISSKGGDKPNRNDKLTDCAKNTEKQSFNYGFNCKDNTNNVIFQEFLIQTSDYEIDEENNITFNESLKNQIKEYTEKKNYAYPDLKRNMLYELEKAGLGSYKDKFENFLTSVDKNYNVKPSEWYHSR